METRVARYFDALAGMGPSSLASDHAGKSLALGEFFAEACRRAAATHEAGNKLMFIGNGGSAAIASHMANDFQKNGRMRAMCFNDGAALTCLGNDLGYEQVFAEPLRMHARAGDLLVAISSSGASPNILNGVEAARQAGVFVVTMSGFKTDNPLRRMGDLNAYVPSNEYGFVEITHLALCHAILDLAMGWGSGKSGQDGGNAGTQNMRLSA